MSALSQHDIDPLAAGWRVWVGDADNRIFEVLKVPSSRDPSSQFEFLFTDREVDQLRATLSPNTHFRILGQDQLRVADLETGAARLFTISVIGEADYYIDCITFRAMVTDPTRVHL